MNQPAHPFSDSSVVISRHREISDAFGLSDGFVTRWLRRYLTAAPDPVTVSDGFQAFVTLGLFRTREDSLRLADSLATLRRYGRAHSDACAVGDGYVASVTEPLVFTTGISMHIIPLGSGNIDSRFPRAYGDMLYIADGAAMSDGVVSVVRSASGLDKNLHIGHDPDGDIDSTYVFTPPVNHAPQWSGAPSSLLFTQGVGGSYAFAPYASDPDFEALTYSLVGAAYSGITIYPTTGVLTVAAAAAAAVRVLTVRIADYGGLYADWTVVVTIASSSEFNPAYPRLAASVIGGWDNFDASKIETIIKYDAVVIGLWRDWTGGGYNAKTLVEYIKSRNPVLLLGQYSCVIEKLTMITEIIDKCTGERGPSGNGDWILRNAAGQPTSTWPGAWRINFSTLVTPDASGLRFPQWYARYGFARLTDSGDWVFPGYGYWDTAPDFVYSDVFYYDQVSGAAAQVDADWDENGDDEPISELWVCELTANGHIAYRDALKAISSGRMFFGNISGFAQDGAVIPPQFRECMEGGVAEAILGLSWSVEEWGGWDQMMRGYRRCMYEICTGPRILKFDHHLYAAPTGISYYRWMRYGLASCLMDNGYYQPSPTDSNNYSGVSWFDEFDWNLGYPTLNAAGAPQTAAYQNGVYLREFDYGCAIVNPKGNGTRTVDLPSAGAGKRWDRLIGTQDPVANSGATNITSVTLPERDGLILKRVETLGWPAQGTVSYLPIVPRLRGPGMETGAGSGRATSTTYSFGATVTATTVRKVTNLNDSGTGSLRQAVTDHNGDSGPSTIVFETSGTISLAQGINVTRGFLSVYGQTAPDPGIQIRGGTFVIAASDVLVQHLVFRRGYLNTSNSDKDSLQIDGTTALARVVIDHCTLQWGMDENLDLYRDTGNITISNCLIGEELIGDGGNLLTDFYDGAWLAFGCLFVSSKIRNPLNRMGSCAVVNTYAYNYEYDGLSVNNLVGYGDLRSLVSAVGNQWWRGPSSLSAARAVELDYMKSASAVYLRDNTGNTDTGATITTAQNQWLLIHSSNLLLDGSAVSASAFRLALEVGSPPYWPTGLIAANNSQLSLTLAQTVGARPWGRDSEAQRMVNEAINRSGGSRKATSYAASGAAAWPTYAENTRTFTPISSPNVIGLNGYTRLEEQIFALEKESSLVFSTTFDGVSLLYVASYGYTYPNGPYTDGYSCADVVRLDGTDVNTGYVFTQNTPRLWGQTSAVRPDDPHITDVLIGTQRSFSKPTVVHDYRIISTTVPGGGSGKALFHRRTLPYVAPDLCAYTFYPNASIKMPTMLYQRFWMRLEPGFTSALNGFYMIGGAKNASGSLATSRCQLALAKVNGQLTMRAYADTEAAGTVGGVPVDAWDFFPGFPLDFPITTPEGQWFKIEFAFRFGLDSGAFVWAALNGSSQWKTGQTVVDGGSEAPSEIYMFSYYTNSSTNPGESFTNWEMRYGWPADASSHPSSS